MEQFVGLDVSQAMTHVCVVDSTGKRLWQGKCQTRPEEITTTIRERAPAAALIGMETGALSAWLWHSMSESGLPIVCIDARHAHRALSLQVNKTDANDALGIAQLMRTKFFKEVSIKSLDSHRIRALVVARAQLVGMRTDLKNQIRALLKTFGCIISHSVEKGFEAKVKAGIAEQPTLGKMVVPLLQVLASVHEQIGQLDGLLSDYAGNDKICRHLMTIPGIGPVTAVAFTAAVDDPQRFRKSKSVGAYFGLTNRRYQSGEMDISGRISKCGDRLVRSYLFEAAGSLLTRTKTWSAIKSWGLRIRKRSGIKKAQVAVARKLAVIMHQMWITGEAFRWSEAEASAA